MKMIQPESFVEGIRYIYVDEESRMSCAVVFAS